jgi:KRAB domain-containing zinc finger protein
MNIYQPDRVIHENYQAQVLELQNHQLYHLEKYYSTIETPGNSSKHSKHLMIEEGHNIESETNEVKIFNCDLCPYQTQKKQDFNKHISSVHKKEKTPCPECGKYLVNIAEHIKLIHRKEKPFQCGECQYKCCFRSDIQKHIDSVHRKLKHSCPECGKEIVNVAEHVRLVHRKKNEFKCHQCIYVATKKQDLKKHTKSVHRDNRELIQNEHS